MVSQFQQICRYSYRSASQGVFWFASSAIETTRSAVPEASESLLVRLDLSRNLNSPANIQVLEDDAGHLLQ